MLTRLLQFINEQHGAAFAPIGRYRTGEQGAFAIKELDGDSTQRFVLKWSRGAQIPHSLREVMVVTTRLRALDYPAPRYRLVGVVPALEVVYSVQEELPGTPLSGLLDRPLLDRLLKLNDIQREQASALSATWPGPVADPVLHGGDGFCLLDPPRSYSAATAALLTELQRLVVAGRNERSPITDVVHFDFQGANILIDGDGVGGVVDWEGCCAGDCAFDLATLYFYAGMGEQADKDQVERLRRLLVARTGCGLLGLYLAHLILRQVDWSIRFHDRAAVERLLRRADEALHRFSAETEQRAVP
jgi:hypothetical protein